MDGSSQNELAALVASARAHLEWEGDMAGPGLPDVALPRATPANPGPASPPQANVPPAGPAPAASPPPAAGSPAPVPAHASTGGLAQLARDAASCTLCPLASGRTQSVFARGNPQARLAFVGEGPGYNEDQQGIPFVGQAGQLLDKMIAAMGFARDDVYVCNVVKCRPPKNRTPQPEEALACKPFLVGQLRHVQPEVIVALGKCAAEHLGCLEAGTSGWRGRWTHYEGIPIMATYHPAFLLRNAAMKRPVWEDLQAVMARLGQP